MMKEMYINVDVEMKIGAKVSKNLPGYVKAIKQADKRVFHLNGSLFISLYYDYENLNAPDKKLQLSVGKQFENAVDQVQVAKIVIAGKEVNIWGILE